MNQEPMDQRWQELESNIHKLVRRFLQNDFPAIEHKPRHVALLQMPGESETQKVKEPM